MATVDTPVSMPEFPEVLHLAPAANGRVRFSREAYHRMFEIGVLHGGKRFELLDGAIYMMSPIGPTQSNVTSRLMELFVRTLPAATLQCRVQQPIVLNDQSEPEPDIAIVRQRDAEYSSRHPEPADIVLLIEVSQSSLKFDLGAKLQEYALAGITEYWVVDLNNREVIVHRDPVSTAYRSVDRVGMRSAVAPQAAPMCKVEVDRLFR